MKIKFNVILLGSIILLLSCSKPEWDNPFDTNVSLTPMQEDLLITQLSDSQVKLEWQSNVDIKDCYRIERKINSENYSFLTSVNANINTYIDTALSIYNLYYYRVFGLNDQNITETISDTIQTSFDEITSFDVQQQDIFTANLSWNHNCNYEAGYIIERMDIRSKEREPEESRRVNSVSKDYRDFIEIANLSANATSYMDDTLIPNNNYEYRINTFTTYNESCYYLNYFDNSMPAPDNLTYEILSANSVKLFWDDNSNGEDGFKIDKKVGSASWQVEYAVIGDNVEQWVDSNAEIGEEIYYKLYAFFSNYNSITTEINISVIQFVNTFGAEGWDDRGMSVSLTNDGGYIITGLTKSYGASSSDIILLKTDSSGNEIWHKIYGGSDSECGYSVEQTSDGGYIVAGETYSYGAGHSDVWLIKTDAVGNEVWNQTFGGSWYDRGYSMIQTNDGGYIITGSKAYSNFECDIWLIKTDALGNEVWNQTYGVNDEDIGYSVISTTDGGYIITGCTYPYDTDIILIKTDALGNEEWNQTFGGTYQDCGRSIVQTQDGGFIITGYKSGTAWDSDVCLIKTDTFGNEEWIKTFGDYSGYDAGYSVILTNDNGYIITGYSASGSYSDVWLIKTDALGNEEWNQTFGGNYDDEGCSISLTNDGNYIITGFTSSDYGDAYKDIWLIKRCIW